MVVGYIGNIVSTPVIEMVQLYSGNIHLCRRGSYYVRVMKGRGFFWGIINIEVAICFMAWMTAYITFGFVTITIKLMKVAHNWHKHK